MNPALKKIYIAGIKFGKKLKNVKNGILIEHNYSWAADKESIKITGENTYTVTGFHENKEVRYIKDYENESIIKIISFYENGNKKYKGSYLNNMKSGAWKYYYNDHKNSLETTHIYENGVKL